MQFFLLISKMDLKNLSVLLLESYGRELTIVSI